MMNMHPFEIDLRRQGQGQFDLSFLLDAPAGRDGFVAVADGHLVRPDGSRLRLWGVNITEWSPGSVMLPRKADAPVYAAALARHGVNCVRLHFLDLPAPRGLIDTAFGDSTHFDAQQLDRLDFWVAELKRHGIYCDLNLLVGRSFTAGDGVADAEELGWAKGASFFDRRLIALQKEYAQQLLTHRNPYTGTEYRHEPAIAIVELVNENSLVEAWWHGRTHPADASTSDPNWRTLPASYTSQLDALYNQFLAEQLSAGELAHFREGLGLPHGSAVPRLHASAFASAPAEQFQREASFYVEIERRFFEEMRTFLRDDLGVRSPLLGSSDHNHEWSGYPTVWANSTLDLLDGHDYWQHEAFPGAKNTPMVNDPAASTVVRLARTALAGKPYIVSEVNHPFPNEWQCEGIPLLAAYAGLQDWDGVIWYTLELKDDPAWQPYVGDAFDISLDPVRMTQLAVGALLFLRGDVRAATSTLLRGYSPEQVYETMRMPRDHAPYYTPGFPATAALHQQVRALFGASVAPSAAPSQPSVPELAWDVVPGHGGVVRIDTERTQALIGFVGSATTRHLVPSLNTQFCALSLSTLDDQPIARATRLLLATGARVENTGQQWNAERTSLLEHGHAPALIEPVSGTLLLRDLAPASAVYVYPLDGAGVPAGEPLLADRTSAGWLLRLGTPATPWYEVLIERS